MFIGLVLLKRMISRLSTPESIKRCDSIVYTSITLGLMILQMIIVSNPLKPFLFTAKLTVRRQLVIKDYEIEIAKAYEAVESSSNQDIASPENWDLESCTTFTRTIVHKTLNKKIGDDDDVFLSGADR